MKLLGHAWIAINSHASKNIDSLILGSIAPEITFYTSSHPFSHNQIHEGGVDLLNWCLENSPEMVDFALGMISHSSKYGADGFNTDENLKILGYKGDKKELIRRRIQNTMNVSPERSKIIAHNLLELAVEISLIDQKNDFVQQFKKSIRNNKLVEEASNTLASCFSKDKTTVYNCFVELLSKAKSCKFKDAKDLGSLWRKMEPRDPEFKINDLADLLIEMNRDFKGSEWKFLRECIYRTESSIKSIVTS